ncbi:hypothetical protein [Mycoplasma phocimorsus]|uniref:hypothetical protein n=1 Tax=Mycoplasma phocimorsus TaxID=3045839 RepID=UPI0024C0538B|nr:hypothetical protein [Mycoplasma phocimorsus]MDJ1648930.1 hypothetical protein [Mycoplasma phocimorsus]
MKVKNIIRWISSTVGTTSSFLISASVSNFHIYEIQYENADNIDVSNLTRKYNSNEETKLFMPKAKNGFIFSGWKLKNETIIDTIAVGTQENIILSPVLINEYPNYSFIKNLFIDSSSKINFDIRVIKIKQLITKEELVFGNEKYQLQKLIVESINNFNNKLIQNTILDSQFSSGNHVSSTFTIEKIEKVKEEIVKTSNKDVSVWGLLWNEVKGWWNNWMSTVFYGLVGAGATIGIGYSAYTAYWNNKRNFQLKQNENLKITLKLYPVNVNNSGHWFGRFYNNGSSIDVECSCQRKFNSESENSPLMVKYILTNTLKNPKLYLYNLDKEGKDGKVILDTNLFSILDYYPGYNTVPFYKYGIKKEKLGDLIINREVITDEELCKMYTDQNKYIKCEHESSCCKIAGTIKKCHIAIEKKKCCSCENKQNKSECECKALCCKNCDEITNCENITFKCMCKKEEGKK